MTRKKKKPEKEVSPKTERKTGILYIVATPIGNLEDITLRAIRILKETDIIAAEDTRHTRKLLSHFSITTPTMSYYKEKEKERTALIIDRLHEGKNIALVSDAGTPGISDPGSILVQEARHHNITVIPIPGPSSLTAALSVAGIGDSAFIFLGFAPARKKQRRDLLQSLVTEKKALVFFEAPHRIEKFLQDCFEVLGARPVFWCRELTKMHEEMTLSSLDHLLNSVWQKKIKGESVFIIAGAEDSPVISDVQMEEILTLCKNSGKKTLKDSVQSVASEYNLSRSSVYKKALKIWKKS